MKKLFFAIAILVFSAGATYAQNTSAAKPAQEKAKHMKKTSTTATADKTTVKPVASTANAAPSTQAVAANKGKHHKKMKKEKAKSGK
ncbi:MAG: hypothetical protein ACTHMM_07315 [Agriterribacter sp.]